MGIWRSNFQKRKYQNLQRNRKTYPEQDILVNSARFFHKLITQKESMSLHENLVIPKRAKSILYHRNPKKKLYRTALENLITLIARITTSELPIK